ncbi:MAG: hypothetical protein M5R36_03560 [Deltaproteobacteria bacterium]|nr:hypothetical protein [Deltaproteobacteria bacterium]
MIRRDDDDGPIAAGRRAKMGHEASDFAVHGVRAGVEQCRDLLAVGRRYLFLAERGLLLEPEGPEVNPAR